MERNNRKPGLYDQQIRAARSVRVHSLMKSRPVGDLAASYGSNKAFTKVLCGTVLTLEVQQLLAEHKAWADSRMSMLRQGNRMSYTERGDFTNCFRRGI